MAPNTNVIVQSNTNIFVSAGICPLNNQLTVYFFCKADISVPLKKEMHAYLIDPDRKNIVPIRIERKKTTRQQFIQLLNIIDTKEVFVFPLPCNTAWICVDKQPFLKGHLQPFFVKDINGYSFGKGIVITIRRQVHLCSPKMKLRELKNKIVFYANAEGSRIFEMNKKMQMDE